ncbi:MAG: hypothetical protein ACLR2E_16305 [Lachnospiraceae bacterium]
MVGLLLGAIVHKGIVIGITALLHLSVDNSQIPLFNIDAVAKTAVFIFTGWFLCCVFSKRRLSFQDLPYGIDTL